MSHVFLYTVSVLSTRMSAAKRLNRSRYCFGCGLECMGPRDDALYGLHIGADWRIRLNDASAAAKWP